jgi:transcriptional regulator with XRE-family HTH domain
MPNNLIETIRLAVFARRITIGEFTEKVGVDKNTITNVLDQKHSPTLPTFLKMLQVLEIQPHFHANWISAETNILIEGKNPSETVLLIWKQMAMLFFQITDEKVIFSEIAKKANLDQRTVKKYWALINYPTLDNLIAIFGAINVELKLAQAADKLPTLLDKPTNLN